MKHIVFEPDTMIPHEFDTREECHEFLLKYIKENEERLNEWRKQVDKELSNSCT